MLLAKFGNKLHFDVKVPVQSRCFETKARP